MACPNAPHLDLQVRTPEDHECGPDCPRCLSCGTGLCITPSSLAEDLAEEEAA